MKKAKSLGTLRQHQSVSSISKGIDVDSRSEIKADAESDCKCVWQLEDSS